MTLEQASGSAKLALKGILQEYPNKPVTPSAAPTELLKTIG